MENFVCIDYMCCTETKLRVTSKGRGFENITYNAVSVIVITELMIIIISFHGFVNNTKSSFILSCNSKLVDYYPQKDIVLLKNNSNSFKNVPLRVKQIINTEHFYTNDLVMAWYSTIPSSGNNLKIITICILLHSEFESAYYNGKGK